jgi:hypothetical protein
VAKFKPPSDLTQFREQLRQQPPERLRELLQGARLTDSRLRGPQLPSHVAAEWKLRAVEQEWRCWREQVEEARGPSWRDDPDMAQADQHWAEFFAQLRATLAHLRLQAASKKPAQSQSQPKPKHAGGQPSILTPDEIVLLQTEYQAIIAQPKNQKQPEIFEALRKLLPKHKRHISPSTLRRLIVQPLHQN